MLGLRILSSISGSLKRFPRNWRGGGEGLYIVALRKNGKWLYGRWPSTGLATDANFFCLLFRPPLLPGHQKNPVKTQSRFGLVILGWWLCLGTSATKSQIINLPRKIQHGSNWAIQQWADLILKETTILLML